MTKNCLLSFLSVIVVTLPFKPVYAEAQVKNFPEISLEGLAHKVDALVEHSPDEAIAYMVEIKMRLTNSMSEEYRNIYCENLFRLGLTHMSAYNQLSDAKWLLGAVPYWTEFTSDFLSDSRHSLAMLNLGDCYYGAEYWSDAMDVYLHAIEVYSMQIDSEDLLGILERIYHASNSSARENEAKKVLWKFLGEKYSYSIRIFCLEALFDDSLKNNNISELLKLVGIINADPLFRYNTGLNIRLLHTGDKFEDEERYLEASLLFSMVLPLKVLLASVEERLIINEEKAFSNRSFGLNDENVANLIDELRAKRIELLDAPKYSANLQWRQARVLALMNRKYEAYFAYLRLIEEYSDHKHIEQFHYATFIQSIECEYFKEAVTLGEKYLSDPSYILFEKPIAIHMAGLYSRFGEVEKLSQLADSFLHRFPFDRVAAQVCHFLGQTLFTKGMVERIVNDFPAWTAEYPDGAFVDSVYYWLGMANLFMGDFQSALVEFDSLLQAHPGSVFVKEAEFRRGVAFFGMSEYKLSREVFEKWLAQAYEHPLLPEAHVFMGDIDAIEANVESALENYRLVESFGGSLSLIEHSYFESSSLLVANKRYLEHETLLKKFVDKYPDSKLCSEAILRVAECAFERGNIAQGFEYLKKGIERFGDENNSDHVDILLDTWWKVDSSIRKGNLVTNAFIKRLLSDEEFRAKMLYNRIEQIRYFDNNPNLQLDLKELLTKRHPLHKSLSKHTAQNSIASSANALSIDDYPSLIAVTDSLALKHSKLPKLNAEESFRAMHDRAIENNKKTLAMRLLRVLNVCCGEPVDLNIFDSNIDEIVSPATLAWIAEIESYSYPERAIERLLKLVNKYPENPAAADAFFLLGQLEYNRSNYNDSEKYYARVLEEYFENDLAPRAAVARGDALCEANRYEEAITAYSLVLNQRNWRGEIWAEVTYKIGYCFVLNQDYGKAQGLFERTYLGFSGYLNWTGKAVLASGKLLEDLEDKESAYRTYSFFINLLHAKDSPHYEEILLRMATLLDNNENIQSI